MKAGCSDRGRLTSLISTEFTMPENLYKLQNGSDLRGVALDGVSGEPVNLTTEIARNLGAAFTAWLSEKTGKNASDLRIAVGRDSRISGPALQEAFTQGVLGCGASVLDAGLATTPAMYMATQFDSFMAAGAVMLTASHLPFNRNGFKFFSRESGLEKQDIKAILNRVNHRAWISSQQQGNVENIGLLDAYAQFLCDRIREGAGKERPFEGRKIIVDAGNGAGGFFAAKVLQPLGADTHGSLYLDPDGNFPNHMPNPEDARAMEIFTAAVVREKADMGIIFDTDVDRAAIVDRSGNPVNRNRLIALLSAIILEEHPGSVIVTDSVTSEGLRKFIEAHGGVHFRFRRGYKNVINKSIELNKQGKESWLAIETSGHGALRENYFLDDGAYLTAKILISYARLASENKHIEELLDGLEEPVESREFRLPISTESFREAGESVIKALEEFSAGEKGWSPEKDNYEGIRIRCDRNAGNGWFLLRLSLHDPVMPLNVESQSEGGINLIVSKLAAFFKEFDFIDSDSLS